MNKVFLITVWLVMISFWMFWYPGVKVATDYHLASDTGLLSILPWSWRQFSVADGMGEYTIFTLWSQPLLSLSELMNLISLSSEVQTKLMGAAILFFGLLGIWKLLDYSKVNDWGKSIGSTFFILNSFFLLMFDGGQFSLNLAYITLPYAILSFMRLLDEANWRERVKFSLAVLLVSIFDIRVIFLLLIILGVYLIFRILFWFNLHSTFNLLPNLLISSTFTIFVLLGFHAYWIIPSFLSRLPNLPSTYDRLSQVNFLSFSSIGHSIFLQQPHWFKNVFGSISEVRFEFALIPILVFLSPILNKKNVFIGFWLTIAIVGIFLSKGSQDPSPGVYLWLFGHFPLFSLFRDPVKFYFLTSLAYSVLIGFTIGAISEIRVTGRLANFGIKATPFIVFLYLFFLARPIYLGWMTGMISQPIYEKEFSQQAEIFKQDTSFSRIFWIPTTAPLGYNNLNHLSVEAARLSQKRPFAVGTKGTYETFNFLREAPFMGEIFDVSGIGYIAYPYLDSRRANLHPDNIKYYYTFLDQLSKRPWLVFVNDSSIPLLKTKEHQDRFFVTPNVWWVIGSDDIYSGTTKSADLKLAKNALIFAEEYSGLGGKIDEFPEAKIVLNKKYDLDLAASLLNSSDLIFPAKNLDFEPNKSGWWKRETADLIRWRDFLQGKYGIDNQDFDLGGGWAVGEESVKLKVKSEKFRKGKILLARVMESSRSGKLKFYQGSQTVGEIPTKIMGDANVRWFEVGQFPQDGKDLEITSSGGINVVNALAVLDKNDWNLYQDKARNLQGRIVKFDEKNIQIGNAPTVTYQQINPTKYRMKISNLSEPSFLVFSQNYDGLWRMDGQTPLPVYSLLNGFRVERDGDFIIEFEAQKYVYLGLVITFLTLLIIFLKLQL